MLVPFQYTLRDALRLSKVAPWLFMSFLSLLLASVWKSMDSSATPTDSFVNVSNLLVFRLLPLASAILTTIVISQEVEQKTIVYLLTRPILRWKLLLGRWAATVTVVFIVTIISLLAAYIGSGVARDHYGIERDILALALGTIAYGALFLTISLLINRALIVCVLFAFGWESSIPNLPTGLQNLSILSHMQAISKHPDSKGNSFFDAVAGALGSAPMNATASAFGLVIFSVVLLGFSAYWFTTHEYIPREDSE